MRFSNVHFKVLLGTITMPQSIEMTLYTQHTFMSKLRQDGSVVIVFASHRVGHTQPGHTKDHHKNGTNYLPAWHAMRYVGVWQCTPTI